MNKKQKKSNKYDQLKQQEQNTHENWRNLNKIRLKLHLFQFKRIVYKCKQL